MISLCKTIWRYRISVLIVFAALIIFDLALGVVRMLILQVGIFLFGVAVGHWRPAARRASLSPGTIHPATDRPGALYLDELPTDQPTRIAPHRPGD